MKMLGFVLSFLIFGAVVLTFAGMAAALPSEGQAKYTFEYSVHDPHTHDIKQQQEHRDGAHLSGEYALHEPDGTQRVVKYIAGPHSGFEAIVERKGHASHPHEAMSYVGVMHWANQGSEEQKH